MAGRYNINWQREADTNDQILYLPDTICIWQRIAGAPTLFLPCQAYYTPGTDIAKHIIHQVQI